MRIVLCFALLALAGCRKNSGAPATGVELVYGGQTLDEATAQTVGRRLTALGLAGTARLESGKLKVRLGPQKVQEVKTNLATGGKLEFFGVDDNGSKKLCGAAHPEEVALEQEPLRDGSVTCYFSGPRGPVQQAAAAVLGEQLRLGLARAGTVRTWAVFPPAFLTGKSVVEARPFKGDNQQPDPGVRLVFDEPGAKLFAEHTEKLTDLRLAIVFDGLVQSAPLVLERIEGGRAMITFSERERGAVESIAAALQAGALPPLQLESEKAY